MKQRQSEQLVRLGSRVLWLGTRVAQLLFLEIVLKQIYDARNHIASADTAVGTTTLFALFSVMVHPIAIGWLDAEGIRYRKYVSVRHANWISIESLRWTGPQVKISFRGDSLLNSRLKFWLSPIDAMTNYGLQQRGDEPTPPVALERIAELSPEHPPKLFLGPLVSPGISNAMIAGFGGAICIVVVGLAIRMFEFFFRH